MSVIKLETALAIGQVVQNALAGDTFEFLRGTMPSTIRGGVVADLAGGFYTFQISDSITVDRGPINIESGANRGVNLREDLDILEVGRPGERLKLRLENPSAAAIVVSTYLLIT